jgi:carboxymethylenebutenolidase
MKSLALRVLTLIAFAGTSAGIAFAQGNSLRDAADTNVTYPAGDGTELAGYLATPEGEGPHPAVLMVHEWWGLNRDIQLLADALAAEGFIVLAPDLLRGSVAKRVPGALAQMRRIPEEQKRADLDAAFAYLSSHEAVDPERIASTGFCFGGTQSMHLGTRNPNLAAVVTYYGSGPIQEPDALGVMDRNEPVLGVFGEEDNQIPLDEVEGFRAALAARGIEHTVEIYPDVGHAFIDAENYNRGGTPQEAWDQMVSFLRTALQ